MHSTPLYDYPLNVRTIPRTFIFKEAAHTSRGVYHERRVWYIIITSPAEPSLFGIGECAPLYDLSADYTADYKQRLDSACRQLERTRCLNLAALRHSPSISFGIETAWRSAEDSLCGDWRLLYDSPFVRGETSLTINGLVWMGNQQQMMARMEAKIAAGFRCVKLKIGALGFDEEIVLIKRLRSRFGRSDIELRVDANGAFSPAEAPRRLEALARYDIHSIEQPIRAGQWREMGKLCRTSPLPIAVDEELIGIDDVTLKAQLLDEVRPQYLVLKPTLHGGLTGAEEWMRLAARRNIPYWVTSALETNVGLNAIAQWTAATAERIWVENKPSTGAVRSLPGIHGLGTGQLFTSNFEGMSLAIDGQRLHYTRGALTKFLLELDAFKSDWNNPRTACLTVHTSGSTGRPKPIEVEKRYMRTSARMTCNFLQLKSGDTALLCMPLAFIAGKMMAVRAFEAHLRLICVPPSAHPFAELAFAPTFVAMTPLQVCETLGVKREAELLRSVKQLIIGGGSISSAMAEALQDFPHAVWSTYGMTETLSHVALRRLNGSQRSEHYMPLPGVSVNQAADGCLVITAPAIGVSDLHTNDICEIAADGGFTIIGRRDNVVCSGGIKLQIEQLEHKLDGLDIACVLTAVPDAKYGEALTLLYVGAPEAAHEVKNYCRERLTRYEVPKHFIGVNHLPLTATGKPDRAAARDLAAKLYSPQ